MKAVLLLNDGDAIEFWQYESLRNAIEGGLVISQIAHCKGDLKRRPRARHFGYNALARASRRGVAALKPTSIRPLLGQGVREVSFSAEREGAWRVIPADVAEGFRGADVVVNFGMDLLRSPDSLPVSHGVLSYSHGDPEQFQGGPAGFYELKQGAEVQGVVVQRLSNTLRGRQTLSKAFAPVVPHSYAQTLQGTYMAGIPLLAKAMATIGAELSTTPESVGPDYQLPTNGCVAHQVAVIAGKKGSRLAYGLFREKRWQVGRLTGHLDLEGDVLLSPSDIETISIPPGYSFVADPFGSPTGGVYCEAFNGRSGKGEIARWKSGDWDFLDLGLRGGHASYPLPVEDDGSVYLCPEIADVSSPVLFRLQPDGVGVSERIEMKGLDSLRLLDPTLFSHEGSWYLFAGKLGEARSRLELWVAPEVVGPYRLHPSSPVCLDPRGARMAGPIADIGGQLYRFGQHSTQNYGAQTSVHRIERLTEDIYEESQCGTIRCSDSWGPHTVSIRGKDIWVDFFTEETSPLAGIRRFKGRYLSLR